MPVHKKFPARLHVLFARASPHAVVIRRGPARSVCTLGWDRRNDRFTLGQWLRGRIYERRSDLSPDGKHLIYFAMNGRWSSPLKGSWTAISRAPYLKAVTLWAKGDCWNGGGLFTAPARYWLNGGHELRHADPRLARDEHYPGSGAHGGECPSVYYLRLQRDGWQFLGKQGPGFLNQFAVFEKPCGAAWTLRKLAHETLPNSAQGRGAYFDQHELENRRTGEVLKFPEWEWAERDGARLVWAASGKLFAAHLAKSGLGEPTELHEFNAMKFERIEAPY